QRLLEQAAHRFASVEPQESGTLGQAEQLAGPRRPQPLEIDRQLRAVEVLAARWNWTGQRTTVWPFRFERRQTIAGGGPEPSVFSPGHLLYGRLPSEGAPSSIWQRPPAQV